MKLSDQVKAIRTALATWAKEQGGTVEVAGDAAHAFSLLYASPGALRVAIWPNEETAAGTRPEGGRATRKFLVVLSRGRSLALEKSDSLLSYVAGAQPLFDLVEDARDLVRGIEFTEGDESAALEYAGWQPLQIPSERILDAYQLTFTLEAQLPEPTT